MGIISRSYIAAILALVFCSMTISKAIANCDKTITGLIRQSGGCPEGECIFDVNNGVITKKTGAAASAGRVFKRDGATSSVKNLSEPSRSGMPRLGVLLAEVSAPNRDGDQKLELNLVTKGTALSGDKEVKSKFVLGAGEGADDCELVQVTKRYPDERYSRVDYDKDYCTAADTLFSELSAKDLSTCTSAMKQLVETYEARATQLAKTGDQFRASSVFSTALTAAGAKSSLLAEAISQRDFCYIVSSQYDVARLSIPPDDLISGVTRNYSFLEVILNKPTTDLRKTESGGRFRTRTNKSAR